jgi:hypothetical protein
MATTTIEEIDAKLRQLDPKQLPIVMNFVQSLMNGRRDDVVWQGMLASEATLAREWNRPEEDEAWADL